MILPGAGPALADSVEQAYGVRFGGLASSMSAVSADSRQAAVLGVHVGEPLFWRRTTITDDTGAVCEISHSFYVAARVYFELGEGREDGFGL
ncbi:UTRA domain-containing protein [Brachybacterium sp. DNPG3]